MLVFVSFCFPFLSYSCLFVCFLSLSWLRTFFARLFVVYFILFFSGVRMIPWMFPWHASLASHRDGIPQVATTVPARASTAVHV